VDAGQSEIPAFKKRVTPCMSILLLMVLFLLNDIKNSYVNAGIGVSSGSQLQSGIGSVN
jgi:hypothetical protein